MDVVITTLLFIVAVCIVFGKTINITITHKYDNPPLPEDANPVDKLQQQTDDNAEAIRSMDAVIQSLHTIMGVNNDVDSNK
jgi:hypothetical protein